jgi:preprotein translocase subunit SecA
MLNIVTKAVTKIFGSKSNRDMKLLLPYIGKINAEWQKLNAPTVSDDDLRAKTEEVKATINQKLQDIDTQIAELHQKVEDNPDLDIQAKEEIFNQVDKLEDERNKKLEEVLLEVLPTAFAIIKETAYRWKENGKLEVTASFWDKQIAAEKSNVKIDGEKAIWANKWLAADSEVTWGMVHYDVQLIGGAVLHLGKIAEMATGEGKTLAATLPAFLNALAKRGVHIVTVNDYLARRDSEWMAPLFEFHGLTVDCIDKHQPNSEARRKAYHADITYGTNNEFGFDYLRDNMADDMDRLVQRKPHYALVDEVDSVLVDEARTPLIISGPVPKGDEHEYQELKPRIARLVEAQKKLCLEYLTQAKKLLKDGKEKEAGLALFRAFRGLPKLSPLTKFLNETGMKVLLLKTEAIYLSDNSRLMPEADEPLYFTIDEKHNQIDLTEKGIDTITSSGEDTTFFILPDVGSEIAQLENDSTLNEKEKLERTEVLINDYAVKSQRIHSIQQLLKAYTLFNKETDYIIVENEVKIVDEQTGRIMQGRRYSDGLHQALEAKENVRIQDATQTYATITLQNYFRMYHKLAGMTGTAETEAGEFWDIYKLDVVVIPTNVPTTRQDLNDFVYKTKNQKYRAVIEEIVRLTSEGRPVLVGTASVEDSETLSKMLSFAKVNHQVLNAKFHQKEAEIIAEAGKSGTVTIATNMAGRGTDIKLSPESKAAGGLAIIGTERHESRRIDRQLRGRAGRQGDPGSSQFFVSLQDNLMKLFGSDRIARVMDRLGIKEDEVIQHSMITRSIQNAQKKVEQNNFGIRKRLLEYDDVMNQQREIIYKRRKNALSGERLELDIMNTLYDTCEDIAHSYQGVGNFENFKLRVLTVFGIVLPIDEEHFLRNSSESLATQVYHAVMDKYKQKNEAIRLHTLPILKDLFKERGATTEDVLIPFSDMKKELGVVVNLKKAIETEGRALIKAMERGITLAMIDQEWKEHLRDMDDLKQSVQNAVYEQKDPLVIYKFEGFNLFEQFIAKVNLDMVSFLVKADMPPANADEIREARRQKRSQQKVNLNKAEAKSLLSGSSNSEKYVDPSETQPKEKQQPIKVQKTYGRNDKVTVQYHNGQVKKDIKYKAVEQDVANGVCVVIEA